MESPSQVSPRARGILDEAKKAKIVALLLHGCSRRTAARYAGCSPSTITRTAAREPEFAAQLARAETQRELGLLRRIEAAAEEPRHLRAAAWLLERANPADFGPRPARTFTAPQVLQMVGEVLAAADGEAALERLGTLLLEFGGDEG